MTTAATQAAGQDGLACRASCIRWLFSQSASLALTTGLSRYARPAADRGTFSLPVGRSITGTCTLQIDYPVTLTADGTVAGVNLINAEHLTLPAGTSTLASFTQQAGATLTVRSPRPAPPRSPHRPRSWRTPWYWHRSTGSDPRSAANTPCSTTPAV